MGDSKIMAQNITLRRTMDYFLEEDALRASATYAKQFITQAVFISSDDKVLIWKLARRILS